jgi:hypothetical protein
MVSILMMRLKAQACGAAALLALAALCGSTTALAADRLPAPAASYEAHQSLTVNGTPLEAHIIHDRGRERRESVVDGLTNLLIVRPDEGKAYVIQPESRIAMTLGLADPEVGIAPSLLAKLAAAPEGQEAIDGIAVTRYRIQDVSPDGGGFDGRVWSTADGLYLRAEGVVSDGASRIEVRMALSGVQRKPPPAKAFDLPPGMRMMTMDALPERTRPATLGADAP